jgi:hypothetical protein
MQAALLQGSLTQQHKHQGAAAARGTGKGRSKQKAVDGGGSIGDRHKGASGDEDDEDDELASQLASMFPTLAEAASDGHSGNRPSRTRPKSASKGRDWAEVWL